MPRDERPAPSDPDEFVKAEMSPSVIAKWRRLTPEQRNMLARASGRDPLATNLRKARENRGLSQEAVAKKLGLSRSLIAQIELANRPVSGDELAKFADLYGTPAVELTGTRVATNDPVTVTLLNLAPALIKQFDADSHIHFVLGAMATRSHLAGLLERPAVTGPATYPVSSPRTLADAIGQGEQVAGQERQRLALHDAPLPDMADLCSAQGVPVFALKLPADVSAIFVAHASAGSAIVVNRIHDEVRRRFAIAHAYAHVLFEGTTRACTHTNAKELIERRADAFAGALLLPESGVDATVRGLGKGQPSRQVQWVFDPATERAVRAEERSTPGSQVITYLDVAWIARRFGAAYRLSVSRMLGQGVISEADSTRLLKPRLVALADEWLTFFRLPIEAQSRRDVLVLSDLIPEHAHMAVEAYRRELLTKADFADEALDLSLQVPGLSPEKVFEFAEAAR